MSAITVSTGNPSYASVAGILFNQNLTALIQYPVGNIPTSYTIPSSVTSIGDYAFAGCPSLTSVSIPNSVTSIGVSAFDSCTNLTSITIPDSVTNIGNFSFAECNNLANVKIGNGVTTIGGNAFAGCYSLTNVTIGKSVTSIGDYAFYGSTLTKKSHLASVYFTCNVPSVDSTVFYYDENATVYYLKGTTGWTSTFGGRPTVAISQSKFTWLQNNFTSAQLGQPSLIADTATPAGDGLPNFLKYAFNLNPFVDGHAALPQPALVNGNLVLTFTEAQPDVTYTVEASTDLVNWSTTGVVLQTNGNQVTASYPVPVGGGAFMHVVVAPTP